MVILQLSTVKGIAIEEAIAVTIAHVVFIAAYEEVPVVAAEVVIDIGKICGNIIFAASRAIISKGANARRDTVNNVRTVVNLSISTNANTIIPRAVIILFFISNFSYFN